MPVELKDVLVPLGFKEEEIEKLTPDDFKKTVDERYVLRENVDKDPDIKNKIVGSVLGGISTALAREFGLTSGEIKGKKVEEIALIYKAKVDEQIKKLQEEGGKTNDKKVEELTKKLGEFEAAIKVKDEGLTSLQQKYDTDIAAEKNATKTFKLNAIINKMKEGLAEKFTADYKANELVRTGFDAHMANTYVFELGDDDKPVVKLRADGSMVKSKKNVGHYASPEEIFEMEMEAKGVLKKNNGGAGGAGTTFKKETGTGADYKPDPKSKISPKALANMERLNGK